MTSGPFGGLVPVCRKEVTHLLRDKGTVFFAAFLPVLQLIVFGFAIDMNIRQVPTAVLDESRTQESRQLIDALANSDIFQMATYARSEAEIYTAIRRADVQVGVHIPPEYAREVQAGRTATVLLLVDGSDSTVTSTAVSTATALSLARSLDKRVLEIRPAVLYNPATRSANFFVPGMIAIVLQAMLMMLIALSVVRERERGTLEQLTMTPVTPLGLMTGKLIPYLVLGFLELCGILLIMRGVFQVPIHGSVVALLAMSVPFLLTVLGIGLMISTKARSQAEAFQLAMGTLLPSVFLSGYIFLISNMPAPFQILSRVIPASYYIRVLRGIILRGATAADLWIDAAALTLMGSAAIALAARSFLRAGSR